MQHCEMTLCDSYTLNIKTATTTKTATCASDCKGIKLCFGIQNNFDFGLNFFFQLLIKLYHKKVRKYYQIRVIFLAKEREIRSKKDRIKKVIAAQRMVLSVLGGKGRGEI